MKYKIISVLLLICMPLFLNGLMASADEEELREKSRDSKHPEGEATLSSPIPSADRFKANFFIGAIGGFDNNVFLDPSRKGDLYDQAMAGANINYKLMDRLAVKTDYNFTSITYHEFTDLSMVDNDAKAYLEYYLNDKLRLNAGYEVDLIRYLRNKNGDIFIQGPFADFRYFFNPRSYIGGGYQYQFYDYDRRTIRNGDNRTVEGVYREDHRHNIIGEFAAAMGKFSFKVKNVYYFNESNDGYMNYYDYQADRITGYITYPLTKEMLVIVNGGYQRKEFKSRQITTSNSKEHDNLMILGCGLYYEILPSLYLNTSYTYRQNYSNDPIQEYSGSTSTAGLYHFF